MALEWGFRSTCIFFDFEIDAGVDINEIEGTKNYKVGTVILGREASI